MAVTAEVRTFWSALISVLLKCIAALGFSTPAPTRAAVEGATPAAAQAADRRAGAVPRIPAPRTYEPRRRERDRNLPPTMKQRIRAEAHGASPSARSLPAGDPTDGIVIPAPGRLDRTALCG